jgi:ATP/maltotriose-dependent transcriptional regulator MalT
LAPENRQIQDGDHGRAAFFRDRAGHGERQEALRAAGDTAQERATASRVQELSAMLDDSAGSLWLAAALQHLGRYKVPTGRKLSEEGIHADSLPPPEMTHPNRAAPPVPDREAMWPDLTEPLTTREQEVLGLLAGRFTNKEIATTLCVSWQTVAKHTNNIYQKLRVTGRREAAERAAALGIFPVGRHLG